MKSLYIVVTLLCFSIASQAQLDSIKQSIDSSINSKTKRIDDINDSLQKIRTSLSSQAQKIQASVDVAKIIDNSLTKLALSRDSLQNAILKLTNETKNKTKEERDKLDSLSKLNDNKVKQIQYEVKLYEKNKSIINELQYSIDSLTEVFNKKQIEIHQQQVEQDKQATIASISSDSLKKKIASLTDTLSKVSDSLNNDIKEKKTISDTLTNQISNETKLLQQREASISKQLDSLEVIAKFDMVKGDSARLHYWTPEKDKDRLQKFEQPYRRNVYDKGSSVFIKIQQINLTVKEGIILECIVQTDKGIYRNSRSVVDLLHVGKDKKTMILFHEHQAYEPKIDSTCIFLDDILHYTPIRSYYDVAYGDFDITLTPTDDGRYYLLRESTSINTYFNIAAFTDIKGISGEPNGLAQFTAEAKFITNTRSFGTSAIVPFNYIAFRGGLAKFDTDFKGTELKNNDSVSRKDLLQRANYALGVKVNLFKWFISPKPLFLYDKFELNAGYNFLGTKVFDTLFKDAARTVIDTTTKSVTQNQWYIEPLITFSRHRNFSMNLILPFFLNNVKHNATTDLGIKNLSTEIWAAPGISLMYFGKRDTGSKLFFRYNNYINLKNKTQSFTQMQLGYSINLTEVWSGSGSK